MPVLLGYVANMSNLHSPADFDSITQLTPKLVFNLDSLQKEHSLFAFDFLSRLFNDKLGIFDCVGSCDYLLFGVEPRCSIVGRIVEG